MRILIATLIALSTVSCQSAGPVHHRVQVTHIVIAWLKQPGDEAARRQVIEESKKRLRTIPGVESVTAGTAIPSTRPVVDASFDVSIVVTFRSVAALQRYPMHPTHQQMVAEIIKPLVARYIIYDVLDNGN